MECSAKSVMIKGFLCEKKLTYGSFFLRTKTFGHNTFCIALHVMKMDNFNYLNYKISKKK